MLHKLGFCSSYTEVQRFENCASHQQNTNMGEIDSSQSLLFVADNVNHNLNTLDGLNTFHGMGMIACITPGRMKQLSLVIKRLIIDPKEIIETTRVETKYFNFKNGKDLSIKFKRSSESICLDNSRVLGNLWQYAWFLNPKKPL